MPRADETRWATRDVAPRRVAVAAVLSWSLMGSTPSGPSGRGLATTVVLQAEPNL